jgi:hypothetical protein
MPKLSRFSKCLTLFISTIVLGSVWTTSASGQAALTERSKLELDGIGPIPVGMTVEEAARAGVRLIENSNTSNRVQCSSFNPLGGPEGISFMVSWGRIVRIDIFNKQVTTVRGAKIGDTEEQILSLYPGQIRVIKNPLGGRGKNLIFVPQDEANRNYRLIFETRYDRQVSNFRTGQLPQVEYIEGCL